MSQISYFTRLSITFFAFIMRKNLLYGIFSHNCVCRLVEMCNVTPTADFLAMHDTKKWHEKIHPRHKIKLQAALVNLSLKFAKS